MRHYSIIWLGKTAETSIDKLKMLYEKKIKTMAKLDFIELKEKKHPDIDKLKEIEAGEFLKAIPKNSYVILLDELGKEYSSIQFSKKIEEKSIHFGNHISFIIGGPYGFADSIRKKFTDQLALSKMTFTHDMARVFLLEQIYRAEMILRGSKYHH